MDVNKMNDLTKEQIEYLFDYINHKILSGDTEVDEFTEFNINLRTKLAFMIEHYHDDEWGKL